MDDKQTQYMPAGRGHPFDELDKPLPQILPGLPGGEPLLPADRLVEEGHEGELVLFDGDDVVQALRQFEIAAGESVKIRRANGAYPKQAVEAMRTVLMFGLSMAAFNTGTAPQRPVIDERLVETEILPPATAD